LRLVLFVVFLPRSAAEIYSTQKKKKIYYRKKEAQHLNDNEKRPAHAAQ
jgi:hypothetical protein